MVLPAREPKLTRKTTPIFVYLRNMKLTQKQVRSIVEQTVNEIRYRDESGSELTDRIAEELAISFRQFLEENFSEYHMQPGEFNNAVAQVENAVRAAMSRFA